MNQKLKAIYIHTNIQVIQIVNLSIPSIMVSKAK